MFLHSTCMRALIHLSSSLPNCAGSRLSALRSCHMTACTPACFRCGWMLATSAAPDTAKSPANRCASAWLRKKDCKAGEAGPRPMANWTRGLATSWYRACRLSETWLTCPW